MWRDRTNLYISYRQSYSHHPAKRPRYDASTTAFNDDAHRGLLSEPDLDNDTVIEMDHLPPRWADVSDEVTDLVSEISKKSTKLDRLHAKHVLPGFDDNRSAEEGEIENLTSDITAMFHDCQNAINRVARLAKGGTRSEEVMSKNIQIALATKVQESSASFRKKQSAYLKKLRGLGGITPPLDRSGSPNPLFLSSSLLDEENDVSYSQSTLQTQRQATLTSNDSNIMQREREITDIAQGILELADIFKDLQTMVIDQGTLLDRIDYNVESMNVSVKAADKELIVASNYQKKGTKRKAILLLILVIVGMIIVLTLKPKKHHFGGSPAVVPVVPPPTEKVGEDMGKEETGMPIDGDPGVPGLRELEARNGRVRYRWRKKVVQ